jgi:hypothetical protein
LRPAAVLAVVALEARLQGQQVSVRVESTVVVDEGATA